MGKFGGMLYIFGAGRVEELPLNDKQIAKITKIIWHV